MANTIRLKRGTTEPTAGVLVTGEVALDTTNGSAYTKLDDGSVTKLVSKASSLNLSVRNETGSPIPAMSAVYINGASGNKPTVTLAQADSEMTSSKTLGLTTASISNNNNGEVVVLGLLEKVDTFAYTAGDTLWLSPTVAGGLTTTKPSAPNHAVFIGTITRVHQTQGTIEVRPQNGYELQELHNVSIPSTPADKDLLSYELSTSLWKNKSAATLGIAELSGATFTGKLTTNGSTSLPNFNLGTISAPPSTSSTVNGDIWIGSTLNFRGSDGSHRTVPVLNTTNTFQTSTSVNPIMIISQLSTTGTGGALAVNNASLGTGVTVSHTNTLATTPAMRITNLGAGHSILVEDETNPDIHAFFVNNVGRVGIGLNPATATLTVPLQVNGSIIGTTESTSDNSTKVATTAYVKNNLANYTATASLNNTAIATSVYVEYADITPTTSGAPLANSVTRIQNIGASSHTITLPDNATQAIPVGSQFVFINEDGVTTTFQAGGTATVYSRGSLFTMNGQYSVVTAIKVAADTWVIAGDLIA